MIRWNLLSNACDVLALGPRTAGQLATVGIRTVNDLLNAQPTAIARRISDARISANRFRTWQVEAHLLLDVPDLPQDAARILSASGFDSAGRVARSAPAEIITAVESLWQADPGPWSGVSRPTIQEVCSWIERSRDAVANRAA